MVYERKEELKMTSILASITGRMKLPMTGRGKHGWAFRSESVKNEKFRFPVPKLDASEISR